jgi:hypothetical protein
MTRLIVLHGLARSGKDTAAGMMKKELEKKGHSVEMMAFADPLKEIGCIMFNMTRQELEDKKEEVDSWVGKSPRWFLQEFGTGFVRANIDPNFWAKNLKKKVDKTTADFVIVTDCRFQNEIIMADDMEAITIKVVRENKDAIELEATKHISEQGLMDGLFQHIVHNNGTLEEYESKIVGLLTNF